MESIRNLERPRSQEAPGFWLSSRELTAWARPRACYVADAVEGPSDAEFLLVRLDPPGPTGELAVIGPRFRGDRLQPVSRWPLVVNIFAAPDGVSPGRRPVGVGELYRTEADAAAADIRAAATRRGGAK